MNALRYNGHQMSDQVSLLTAAAADAHGRVRVGVITAASWLPESQGLAILDRVEKTGLDDWMKQTMPFARASLNDTDILEKKEIVKVPSHLKGADKKLFLLGHEVYHRDAHCATCHQADGRGLEAGGFPPLNGTKWATQNPDRLIKLTLKGMLGKITVKGKEYNGMMTPFEGMITDEETAAVLSYIRNSFGNKASMINPEQVKKIRAEIKNTPVFLKAEELLKEHPHEK